jgi:dTDP-4-dehydrorhamnose 3,5-epimerase
LKLFETPLEGVYVLEAEPIPDERGCFARAYAAEMLAEKGLIHDFPEHSLAHNRVKGTVRGLHYQAPPHAETKIVRCTRGALYDVAADLRPDSATYRKWTAVELSAENYRALYIPAGCAHGYQTLADDTDAYYMISEPFMPELARGVSHADPLLAVSWPLEIACISERDRALPRLS